jgi:hypothetical protein
MEKVKVFISFDYDHDNDIKGSFVAQSKNEDSPFDIIDMSIKEAIDTRWKANARKRIKSCDCVIILCGEFTDTAKGVTAELSITQEENVPYFLLKGRKAKKVKKPLGAKTNDEIYKWTRQNLKQLLRINETK